MKYKEYFSLQFQSRKEEIVILFWKIFWVLLFCIYSQQKKLSQYRIFACEKLELELLHKSK